MPDTYNENEIVKLKHLNEFARQLRVKLDGETDPKPARTVTRIRIPKPVAGQYVEVPLADLEVSIPLADMTKSTTQKMYPQFMIYTPMDIAPIITCAVDIETSINGYQLLYGLTSAYPVINIGAWRQSWSTDADPEPCTFTFTVHFDETDTYAAYDTTVIVHYVQEE